jgi:ABC-type uncharacterized transport system involved in gliding motility auxiliary subunit
MLADSRNKNLFLLAAVGSVVLLNLLAVRTFFRLDVTREGVYTLAKASKDTMTGLDEPVTVTAYFTENLPAPYSGNARYVRDLLSEYRSASKGRLSFEFIDPSAQETDADKEAKREVKQDIFGRQFREPTSVERDLASLGVQPVEIRVVEQDQMQTKRAYMGLVIKHQEKKEVIPVVQDVGGLEYDLTSLIRKMTRPKTPVLGIIQGHDEPNLNEKLTRLQTMLSQLYEVRPGPLLATYGITVGDKLVADAQSAQLSMQERRGFMVVSMPVPFPFIPVLQRLELDSPITKGISGVTLPFVTDVTVNAAEGSVGTVLAKSSAKSWLEAKPYNIDPRRDWRSENDKIKPTGPHNLIVQVSGKLKSHFASEASASSASAPVLAESTGEARVIVAGGSSLLWDDFMGRPNQALLLNVADWLLLDPALLAMRTRGLAEAPLQQELSEGVRNGAKFGNALGIPLLLALYGIVRWRRREASRTAAVA